MKNENKLQIMSIEKQSIALLRMYLKDMGVYDGPIKSMRRLLPMLCEHLDIEDASWMLATLRKRFRHAFVLYWFKRTNCTKESFIEAIGIMMEHDTLLRFEKEEKTFRNNHKNMERGYRPYIQCVKGSQFYRTQQWRTLRYQALIKHGNRCMCCGRGPNQGIIVHVDHIKPKSVWPEFALDINNLQILCEDCNLGKSNKDHIPWKEMFDDASEIIRKKKGGV